MSWLGTTAVWTLQLLIVKLLTLNYAKRDASLAVLSKMLLGGTVSSYPIAQTLLNKKMLRINAF